METILGWFIVGSFFWWILTVGACVWLFWSVEHENVFSVICNLILYLLMLQFLSKVNVIGTVAHNPFWVPITLFVLYLLLGTVWSFIKWWMYIKDAASEYEIKRSAFLISKQMKATDLMSDDLKAEWKTALGYGYSVPTVNENKSKITCWIMCWPVSLIWSLIDDFVRQLVHRIIEALRKLYQSIVDRAFKGFVDEINYKDKRGPRIR